MIKNKKRYKIAIGPSSFAAHDGTPKKILEEADVTIASNPFGRRLTEQETIAHLSDVDGLIAGLEPLNRNVLSKSTQLKAIARVGIGLENVDLEAAKEFGIKISHTPDVPTQAVAEMTMTMMLALCRKVVIADRAMHEGRWEKMIGIELAGTNVLVVGYGRIGRRVTELLQAFGADVFVTDPYVSQKDPDETIHFVSLEDGLKNADVITIHASGTELLLSMEHFDIMKEGTLLLNSARGKLVEESALIEALECGKVSGAWFDAFWEEPYRGRLKDFSQVLLTPHISTYTRQCRSAMETEAVKNLLRDLM